MDDVVYEEFKGTGNMELMLNRKLQERECSLRLTFRSPVREREDLLLDKEEQEAAYIMRKAMNGMKAEEASGQPSDHVLKNKKYEELVQQIIVRSLSKKVLQNKKVCGTIRKLFREIYK